jgi:hypothetical protein
MTLNGTQVVLSQKTVNNAGVVTWNSGQISTGNGAIINNLATATFNNTFDGTFAFDQGGTLATFNNAGTFSKTAGSATTTFSTAFNNTGTVNVQSGTLSLSGGGTEIAGSALSGGTWNISGISTLSIPGASITSSAARVTLDGLGASFPAINSLASNSGSLTITNGHIFTTAGAFANTGTLTVGSGSTLATAAGHAYVQAAGTTNLLGGTLASATGVSIAGGSLTGSGTIGGTLTLGGTLSPGNSAGSAGSLAVTGNLSLSGTAHSLFELGGTAAGSFDTVNVTGSATLGGTLGVSFINGFAPALGNAFDILDWSTLSGKFSSLQLPALTGSLAWSTNQLYTTGVLSVVDINFQPGDFNRDHQVTATDIPAMLSALTDLNSYAATNSLSATQLAAIGDFDNSGTVTNRDIQGLLDLVASQGGGGTVAAVPEPSTLVLLLLAAAGWSLRRGRAA